MREHTHRRSAMHILLMCEAALMGAAGCGPKNVGWNYGAEAPGRLGQARRIALLADREIHALTEAVASELQFRGYAVTVLEPAGGSAQAPAGNPPAPLAGADLVFELSARYVREPEAGTRVKVWPWVSVKVAHGTPKRWYILVSDAKLDLVDPRSRSGLGTVTARYDEPQEDLNKVAKKLGEGLEQIRQGKKPKTD
ncbi:MAG: hypothetical protein JXQ73_14790 [Phycisphaerae bacterium]|nr:hypothetical protein [Phycisphaerae bacterium]